MTDHPLLGRRTVLTGALAVAALAAAPRWAVATEGRPWTIPALREWTSRSGSFWLNSPATVVLSPADAEKLIDTAEVLAADLRAAFGVPAQVVVRDGDAARGEVALRLGANDAALGAEGYRLDLGPAAAIIANTAAGAFYGTRSLLQLLAQGGPVPAGVARDWPRYAERGLMVDIGRKHFSYDWLADRIRECAYLKLNSLHLHFTEDLGWRIESEQGIHDPDQHLTKQQVSALIELAARHHITVVPEVDMPGHMGAALVGREELQLTDMFGRKNPGKLDFTLEAAREYARDLVTEYLPLFPGPYWHMGADEFLPAAEYPLYPQLAAYGEQHGGNAKDGILAFVNEINELVRAHGKTMRVWADGIGGAEHVKLTTNVITEWWTDFSPLSDLADLAMPDDLLRAGHRIHNASWYPTYYSNLPGGMPPKPDLQGMYETWRVHRFRGALYLNGEFGAPYHDIPADTTANLGSSLHIWNDDPEAETEEQIAVGIYPRLRVMAQHTWESPLLVPSYDEFRTIIAAVGAAPGASA